MTRERFLHDGPHIPAIEDNVETNVSIGYTTCEARSRSYVGGPIMKFSSLALIHVSAFTSVHSS